MLARTFGQALKAAREAADLSQAALAQKAGLTGSYVCVLEGRRKRPPSPKVVAALCKALGIDDTELQELAGLERSPDPIRRRLERLDRERGRAVQNLDRLISGTLFHVAQRPGIVPPLAASLGLDPSERALLGRLVGRVRRVRTVREADEKAGEILGEVAPKDREALAAALPRALGAEAATAAPGRPGPDAPAEDPAATGPATPPASARRLPVLASLAPDAPEREWLDVDPSWWTPRAFLWRANVDDAWPRVEPGDLLLVDPDLDPAPGDLVALREGSRDAVRTWERRGDEVRLAAPRPDVPPLRRAAGFRPVGVVRRIVRALR